MSAHPRIALAVFLSSLALPQTTLTLALADLTRFYGAAVSLVANAISGVNKIESAQIPNADRKQVVDELKKVSQAISKLRSGQAPLVVDLADYVNKVRSGQLSGADRDFEWGRIDLSMAKVSEAVRTTLAVVDGSRWLKVALTAEDRLALRETLQSRDLVLSRLMSLPPPQTASEIDQLDRMNKFYQRLVKSLGELNAALTRAVDRLPQD